jgi:F-type H+-transporting ATPase subunit beta
MNIGKLTQVIGSVFDARFAPEQVPTLYNTLEVTFDFAGKTKKLLGEVQCRRARQHIGPTPRH